MGNMLRMAKGLVYILQLLAFTAVVKVQYLLTFLDSSLLVSRWIFGLLDIISGVFM